MSLYNSMQSMMRNSGRMVKKKEAFIKEIRSMTWSSCSVLSNSFSVSASGSPMHILIFSMGRPEFKKIKPSETQSYRRESAKEQHHPYIDWNFLPSA